MAQASCSLPNLVRGVRRLFGGIDWKTRFANASLATLALLGIMGFVGSVFAVALVATGIPLSAVFSGEPNLMDIYVGTLILCIPFFWGWSAFGAAKGISALCAAGQDATPN